MSHLYACTDQLSPGMCQICDVSRSTNMQVSTLPSCKHIVPGNTGLVSTFTFCLIIFRCVFAQSFHRWFLLLANFYPYVFPKMLMQRLYLVSKVISCVSQLCSFVFPKNDLCKDCIWFHRGFIVPDNFILVCSKSGDTKSVPGFTGDLMCLPSLPLYVPKVIIQRLFLELVFCTWS